MMVSLACPIFAIPPTPRFASQVRLDQGNALLVGVGGSGKQSLTKLCAFTAGCEVFEITLSRGYDETMFRDDLKKLYTMLGADNKKVVFLFTDSHVVDEGFLELINNMLTSGMVPALYADDEKDACINGVRDEVRARLRAPYAPLGRGPRARGARRLATGLMF